MFEKVVSAVAYSPSSLHELVRYYNLCKLDYKKRLLSLLFLLLCLIILIFYSFLQTNKLTNSIPSQFDNTNYSTKLSGVEYTSKIENISSEIKSDNRLVAKAGDLIRYELYAENTTTEEKVVDIKIKTDDLLEYAKLSLDYGGAFFDQNQKTLTWNNVVLKPQSTVIRQFSAKINLNISNASSSGSSYDCKISTFFGNALVAELKCSIIKSLEILSSQLPKINTFVSLFFISLIALVTSFQIVKLRTIKKEISIIRNITTKGVL